MSNPALVLVFMGAEEGRDDKIDLAVASHSTSVRSSLKHLVTSADVAEEEEQEQCVQNPDGFASSRAKESDSVREVDDPTEDQQGNSPFPIDKSGWNERKEARRKYVDQRPKADIDREQRRGPGGGVEDDSNSQRNRRNFRHGLSFSPPGTRSAECATEDQTNRETVGPRVSWIGGHSVLCEICLFISPTLKTI
jgi:hypothetical protein